MGASQSPAEFRMEGVMLGGEVYVKETDCRAGMQRAMSINGNNLLLGALRSIIQHWDEFGAEHGFEETIDRARKIARLK